MEKNHWRDGKFTKFFLSVFLAWANSIQFLRKYIPYKNNKYQRVVYDLIEM
jgi:hypothetical protein